MNLFMIPERIRLVVELGDGTLRLATRIVDMIDQRKKANAEIVALAGELNASSGEVAEVVRKNPDPNPND